MKRILSLVAILFFALTPVSPAFAQTSGGATLALSPSSGTLNRGCTYNMQITLDTGSAQTDGTDGIFFYKTNVFTTNTNAITNGTVYSEYLGNNVDTTAGRVFISGIAPFTQPFSGKGTFATIQMTVKSDAPLGPTDLSFDFDTNDKTKSTDSNVAERNKGDILSAVTNGNYTIGTGTCSSTGGTGTGTLPTTGTGTGTGTGNGTGQGSTGNLGSSATPSGTVDQTKGGLPNGGTQEFTYMITIVGFVLTILGIFGFAIL